VEGLQWAPICTKPRASHGESFKIFQESNYTNSHQHNTVEGTNNGLKIMIRPRNRGPDMDNHLLEFVWRRKNASNLWEAFILALKEIHYDIE
jgi:hypothetical protein